MHEYHVDAFVPTIAKGCGSTDKGWDVTRCKQFAAFLNGYAAQGWKLHSSDYRVLKGAAGCAGQTTTTWLVCVFERGT